MFRKNVVNHIEKLLAESNSEINHSKKLAIAQSKFSNFTGKQKTKITSLHVENADVAYQLGIVKGIIYEAEIDGEKNDYIHKFNKASAPLLVVSFDGKQLYILGGEYIVTNRGIENTAKGK